MRLISFCGIVINVALKLILLVKSVVRCMLFGESSWSIFKTVLVLQQTVKHTEVRLVKRAKYWQKKLGFLMP